MRKFVNTVLVASTLFFALPIAASKDQILRNVWNNLKQLWVNALLSSSSEGDSSTLEGDSSTLPEAIKNLPPSVQGVFLAYINSAAQLTAKEPKKVLMTKKAGKRFDSMFRELNNEGIQIVVTFIENNLTNLFCNEKLGNYDSVLQPYRETIKGFHDEIKKRVLKILKSTVPSSLPEFDEVNDVTNEFFGQKNMAGDKSEEDKTNENPAKKNPVGDSAKLSSNDEAIIAQHNNVIARHNAAMARADEEMRAFYKSLFWTGLLAFFASKLVTYAFGYRPLILLWTDSLADLFVNPTKPILPVSTSPAAGPVTNNSTLIGSMLPVNRTGITPVLHGSHLPLNESTSLTPSLR